MPGQEYYPNKNHPKFRKEFAIPIAVVLITLSIVVVVVLLVYHYRRKRRNKQTPEPSVNAVSHSKYKTDDMVKPKQNVGIVPDSSKTYPSYEIASLSTAAPPVEDPQLRVIQLCHRYHHNRINNIKLKRHILDWHCSLLKKFLL
ncbi:unnamed protein product [Trichobilharzia szidati]|nr:unnamed protein product [Trichobilharzia szidati]